jgi:hypothetical protein
MISRGNNRIATSSMTAIATTATITASLSAI